MVPSTERLKRQLIYSGADPFQIAAEAIERGDRLLAYIQRIESDLVDTSLPMNSKFF
tara:strand:- start:14526 stop:14696 length:171 start_codon:yes stop_codon:yes gene_type:complete